MDEGELRRGLEAGHRRAAIADWEEKAPVMVLPDHEYLALREAKWLQRPAEYREKHPFDPARVLARRERKRARTLARIEQSVREAADDIVPILIENHELIGATGRPRDTAGRQKALSERLESSYGSQSTVRQKAALTQG